MIVGDEQTGSPHPRHLSRSEFLWGLGGLGGGAALGAFGQRAFGQQPAAPVPNPEPPSEPSQVSYAQSGEDIIVESILDYVGVKDRTYLDIGAYDPVFVNNTYYFYKRGHQGVLVEPNVTMCEKLRAVRPRDTTLVAGIGVTAQKEADYYVMTEPAWNTFSKEEADHQARQTQGRIKVEKVIKMPLLNVNDVMRDHFGGKAPAFVSIDAEGIHLDILKSIDYARFRPAVICVETLVSATKKAIPEIPAFMTTVGYVPRGGSFFNTIFVDNKLLEEPKK